MTSAQLSRVVEVTPERLFAVLGADGFRADVLFTARRDSLYCRTCIARDNCEHTARVRLSGILTHSIVKNVRTRKKEPNAATAAKER